MKGARHVAQSGTRLCIPTRMTHVAEQRAGIDVLVAQRRAVLALRPLRRAAHALL